MMEAAISAITTWFIEHGVVMGITATISVYGTRLFYGARFQRLEKEIQQLKESGVKGENRPDVSVGTVISGDVNVTNHYTAADGSYHAEFEGKGEIISPTPVEVHLGNVSFGALEGKLSVEPYPPLKWYQKPLGWFQRLWHRLRCLRS